MDDTKIVSLLDLGCGFGFHIPFPRADYKIGLDIHEPSLKHAKKRYDDVILADVRTLPIRLESVDRVSLMEVIEHLDKDCGENLLSYLSRSVVLLTTPLDYHSWRFWCQIKRDPRHRHLSHWTCKNLERLGLKTYVMRFDLVRRLIFQTRGIVVAQSRELFPNKSERKPTTRANP